MNVTIYPTNNCPRFVEDVVTLDEFKEVVVISISMYRTATVGREQALVIVESKRSGRQLAQSTYLDVEENALYALGAVNVRGMIQKVVCNSIPPYMNENYPQTVC